MYKYVLIAVLLAATLSATAEMTLTINCTSGGQSVVQEFQIPCIGGIADWTLPGSVDLMNGETRLATIKELTVQTDEEPYVNLYFAVEAGSTDTTFDITSALVSLAPLSNPTAYASAGVTLTSDANGATIAGLFDGDLCYQARYDGMMYANLIEGFSVSGDQTLTQSDRSPLTGYQLIPGAVSNIQSEFKFTLSALDQASGTSRFEVVPEPATICLLAGGVLALIKRKNN